VDPRDGLDREHISRQPQIEPQLRGRPALSLADVLTELSSFPSAILTELLSLRSAILTELSFFPSAILTALFPAERYTDKCCQPSQALY
jgi:hypothetical protein